MGWALGPSARHHQQPPMPERQDEGLSLAPDRLGDGLTDHLPPACAMDKANVLRRQPAQHSAHALVLRDAFHQAPEPSAAPGRLFIVGEDSVATAQGPKKHRCFGTRTIPRRGGGSTAHDRKHATATCGRCLIRLHPRTWGRNGPPVIRQRSRKHLYSAAAAPPDRDWRSADKLGKWASASKGARLARNWSTL